MPWASGNRSDMVLVRTLKGTAAILGGIQASIDFQILDELPLASKFSELNDFTRPFVLFELLWCCI
jgi:hypothetical protein